MGALQVSSSLSLTFICYISFFFSPLVLSPHPRTINICFVLFCLQRLAEDSNPAIAAAASRTINELKRQWEIEERDYWRFMVNQMQREELDKIEDDTDSEWS